MEGYRKILCPYRLCSTGTCIELCPKQIHLIDTGDGSIMLVKLNGNLVTEATQKYLQFLTSQDAKE